MPIRTKKMNPADSEQDENSIELPEVKDIPGQEYIKPPAAGILADDTPSSLDEEGDSILDDDTDEDILTEKEDADFPGGTYPMDEDDRNIKKMALEDRDDEGEELNEDSDDLTGEDLDVPGADEDDDDEEIGEEDEENNSYSLPDQE